MSWQPNGNHFDCPSILFAGKVFRTDRPSYAAMMETNRTQGRLFPVDDTLPCHCTD